MYLICARVHAKDRMPGRPFSSADGMRFCNARVLRGAGDLLATDKRGIYQANKTSRTITVDYCRKFTTPVRKRRCDGRDLDVKRRRAKGTWSIIRA